ncbi:hypothetical protein GGX14DRAFT_392096 [Mycena pura]|uniref:Uncharacterized protein n=1 Tax=Mycena pura TaxID=153505 RepID=A0AAD6VS15_9AGAR|nr:hypothetical protein GGX14DRAFT_392096 [Mycena pura]
MSVPRQGTGIQYLSPFKRHSTPGFMVYQHQSPFRQSHKLTVSHSNPPGSRPAGQPVLTRFSSGTGRDPYPERVRVLWVRVRVGICRPGPGPVPHQGSLAAMMHFLLPCKLQQAAHTGTCLCLPCDVGTRTCCLSLPTTYEHSGRIPASPLSTPWTAVTMGRSAKETPPALPRPPTGASAPEAARGGSTVAATARTSVLYARGVLHAGASRSAETVMHMRQARGQSRTACWQRTLCNGRDAHVCAKPDDKWIRYNQLILAGPELPPLEAMLETVPHGAGLEPPSACCFVHCSCTTSLHSWHPVPGAHALTAAPDTRLGAWSWTLLFALCHALVAMRAVLTVLLDHADVALAGATMGNCGGAYAARRAVCALAGELAVSLSLLGALVMALFRELQHREHQSEARSRACPTSSTPARGCGRCTAAALGGVLRRAGGRGGGGGGYAAAAGSGCGGGGWRERRRGSGDGNRSSTTVKWFTCTSIHLIDLNVNSMYLKVPRYASFVY